MIVETRRKRKRIGGGGAFTVADLPRPPRRAVPQTPVNAAPVVTPPVVARPLRVRTTDGGHQEEKEEERLLATTTTMMAPPPPPRLVDRRVLLSRASRMQLMLLERLRCVNLRRARRAKLLDEITRLKKIMAVLQNEIDATTRSLESLEQLVNNLQQISFDSAGSSVIRRESTTDRRLALLPPATRFAPGTILWTNPALLTNDEGSETAAQAERLSRAAAEDARKAKANGPGGDRDASLGGCRVTSSHPG